MTRRTAMFHTCVPGVGAGEGGGVGGDGAIGGDVAIGGDGAVGPWPSHADARTADTMTTAIRFVDMAQLLSESPHCISDTAGLQPEHHAGCIGRDEPAWLWLRTGKNPPGDQVFLRARLSRRARHR